MRASFNISAHNLLHNKSPPCYNPELWHFVNTRLSTFYRQKLRNIAAGKREMTYILRQVKGFPCQRFVNSPMSITFTYLPCHVADDAGSSSESKYLNSSFSSQCVSIFLLFSLLPAFKFPGGRSHTNCVVLPVNVPLVLPLLPQQLSKFPLVCVWKRHTHHSS